MSILIRGMEMPKNCAECPVNLYVCQHGYEYLLEHPELYDQRAEDCPISYISDVVPVRHGRWIDRLSKRGHGVSTYCSCCGQHSGIGGIKSNRHRAYCPNCGALMDKDGDGE